MGSRWVDGNSSVLIRRRPVSLRAALEPIPQARGLLSYTARARVTVLTGHVYRVTSHGSYNNRHQGSPWRYDYKAL